jgi:hypothetical protein
MKHVRLFPLKYGFDDTSYPGHRFSSWHPALTDRPLTAFTEITDHFIAERMEGPHAAEKIASLTGHENRSLLRRTAADEARSGYETDRNNGLAFATGHHVVPAFNTKRHDLAAVFAG